jgi:S-layer homology domain
MKKLIVYILIISVIVATSILPVQAHGLIYETKKISDNKMRITLKWSNPKEAKGIIISYFYLKNGKTLNIGYELSSKAKASAYIDYDLSGAILPIRVVINKVGDLKWVPFKDIKGIEAEEYIRHLHDAGIIDTGSDGKFNPKRNLTRADFATILVKALKIQGTVDNKQSTKDIEKNPSKKYILLALKKGLVKNHSDKTFRPDDPVSLEQVACAIDKAFKFKTNKNGIYLKLKNGKSYSDSVRKMFDSGMLNVDDSIYIKFNEENKITRADFAMMISRALSTY